MNILRSYPEYLDQIQENVIELARSSHAPKTMILCFYSDAIPQYCDPMPRFPSPSVGINFDEKFGDHLGEEISKNPALHDGAMMFERSIDNYCLSGWSYRLCAPSTPDQPRFDNRGSAFNSCLAMSAIENVDCLFLISTGQIWRFINGGAFNLDEVRSNFMSGTSRE